MEIRKASAQDADEIAKMECDYFSDPWSQKDIFSYICSEDGLCYTALSDEGVVIAYVIGRKIPPEGEIYRIAVKESHRQRGIGYRLLSYALKTEMGHGLETVFLEVRSKNTPAIRLYKAHGFTEVGIRKNYYNLPTDDAIVMVRDRALGT